MSDLIMRAEQGVLAALLAGTDHDRVTTDLTTADFGHPTHQAIYTALRDLDPLGYDTARLTQAVADMLDQRGVDADWLTDLATAAPDADRVRAYTQIVTQAAFDRDIADLAEPYHAAAHQATDPTSRAGLTRLAAALDAQAAVFTPASTIDPDRNLQMGTTAAFQADITAELHPEDKVIADIVQHPDQARAVATWLDPAVFTTEQRKLTFEIAVSIAYDHDPLDAVILAWHVQRAREINALYPQGEEPRLPEPRTEPDYTYITRLETTTVTPGTAVIIGRELLTTHVKASVAAAAAEATIQAAPAQPAPVQQQARQIQAGPPTTPTPAVTIRPIEL